MTDEDPTHTPIVLDFEHFASPSLTVPIETFAQLTSATMSLVVAAIRNPDHFAVPYAEAMDNYIGMRLAEGKSIRVYVRVEREQEVVTHDEDNKE